MKKIENNYINGMLKNKIENQKREEEEKIR